MELVAPFETSGWVERERQCLIIALRAEGLTGWGECVATQVCGYSYETTKTAWHILEDFLLPMVLGKELEAVDTFVAEARRIRGHPMAKAALEAALWDLFAQAQGVGLQQLLGGQGDRVRVGVSVGIQPSPEALVEVVRRYLSDGYPRVKLKIKPGKDLDYTRAVRQAFPDVQLQVDANSAYRLADAPVFEAMDDLDLLLIEQPLGYDDIYDHSRLQPLLKTPICLDESIHTLEHARWALDIGACRNINIKPARVGGLTEAVRIHDLCCERGVPVWCGGMLETGVGRAANVALASLPGFALPGDISASARYFHEDIVEPAFALNPDGTLSVPAGSGLGVRVKPDALERFTLRRQSYRP